MNGHDRAVVTAYWIRTKPERGGKRIPLETYIKAVCKQKKWTYKPPKEKKSEDI